MGDIRRRALYIILFSAMVLFGIHAVTSFSNLAKHDVSPGRSPQETSLWTASKLARAYVDLQQALAHPSPGGDSRFEVVQQALDDFRYRLNLISADAAAPRAALYRANVRRIDELNDMLKRLAARLHRLEGSAAERARLLTILVNRQDLIDSIVDSSMLLDAERRNAQAEDVSGLIRNLTIDLIVLAVSALVLVALLVRQISRAEESRRTANEARDLLSQAVEGITDGFALFDRRDRLIMCNKEYYSMCGAHRHKDIVGESFETLVRRCVEKGAHPGLEGQEEEWTARRLAAHREGIPFEEQLSDGRWILARDQRIEQGGTVCLRADITDRKRAEDKLRDALTTSQTAAQAKSEFLAIMSHEMRTPLNGVLGLLGLLLDSKLEPEQRGYLLTARESGEMLLSLIEDILDFSKIEAGKLELEDTAFSPAEIVQGVVDLLAPRAHAKGVEIDCYVDRAVPAELCGDPGRLRQIFLNLAGNSVKFTERGGVTVELSLSAEDDDEATLSGVVTDTGIGIPYDAQENLFSEFSQLDASYSRRFGGSGLGLAITRRLVEAMNGAIRVGSEPGQGTVFSFTVQLGKAADSQPAVAAPNARRKILFWADSGVVSALTVKLLRAEGHEVLTVRTENEARARLSGQQFDVILIDCKPQDETGFLLARKLREQGETLPIFLLRPLGWDVPSHLREDANRITGLIQKPIQPDVLRQALETLSGDVSGAVEPEKETSEVPENIGRGYRILLAEDSPTNRLVASALLRRAGYRVDWVIDGAETVEAVQRLPYDLILMDISMPNMDGIEATRVIRATAGDESQVPIVALTAHAMPGDRERFLQAGMDGYLTKPLRPKELFKTIQRYCPARPQVARADTAEVADTVGQEGNEPAAPITAVPAPRGESGDKVAAGPVRRTSDSPVVDETVFRQLREDAGAQMVPQLVEVFLNEVNGRVEEIRAAQQKGAGDTIAKQAHALKSSAGSFGAMKLHFLAKDLELAARQEKQDRMSVLVSQLFDMSKQTVDQFRSLVE